MFFIDFRGRERGGGEGVRGREKKRGEKRRENTDVREKH